jgi:colanic acid biosynthesis protein WcaH
MLPIETFKTVIASTPLISIDLIVRNNQQQILLGKRLNKPAQGYWFVPGGRILKDERLECAYKRLAKAELGIKEQALESVKAKFKGIYQHFYNDNVTGSDFSTHYVVMAYEVEFDGSLGALPKDQHSNYKWLSEKSLLIDNIVHKHTKWYFQKGQNADAPFTI